MERNRKVCKLIMMKTRLLIAFSTFWIGLWGQSQSNGYVLRLADGTIQLPANTISISQINLLQSALDAKAPLASPTFTTPALGTPVSGNFSTGTFTWPTFNQSTTGSAATLTTSRNIQGVAFNGSAAIDIINGTGFVKATGTTLSYDNSTYQPLNTRLTSIGALTNASGFLKNDGAGNFSYDNPAGSGTVTDISVVSANGISGSVATSTSTPAITLSLGAITPTTVNGVTITDLLPKTTTAGVGSSPTASGTTTVTHNLGRVPNIIRIYGYGSFTSNAAATATTSSMGVFNSSGNFCVYQRYGAAITTTQAALSSNTFSILLATGGGNYISGVIQNVTSTQFDIVWTETGTATAQVYLWEAQ
jgi:hypothetical protein